MLKKGSFAALLMLIAALAVFVSACNDSKDDAVWPLPTNVTQLDPEKPTALIGEYKITRVQAYFPDNPTEPLFDTADASYAATPSGYFSVGANKIAIDNNTKTTSVNVVYAAKFAVSFDKISPVKDTAQNKFSASYIDAQIVLPPLPNLNGGTVPDIDSALESTLAALNGNIDYDNHTLTLVISPAKAPITTKFGELTYTSNLNSYKVVLTMEKTADGQVGFDPKGYPSAPTAIDFNNPESLRGSYVISSFENTVSLGKNAYTFYYSTDKYSVQYMNGELSIDNDASGLKITSKIGIESLYLIAIREANRQYQYTDYPIIPSAPAGDKLVYTVNPPRPSGQTGDEGDIDNVTIIKVDNNTLNIELGTFQDLDVFHKGICPATVILTVEKVSDTPVTLKNVPYWSNTAINPSVISTLEGHYLIMDNVTFTDSNGSIIDSEGFGEVSAALNGNGEMVVGIKYQRGRGHYYPMLPDKLSVLNKAGIIKSVGTGSFEYLGADNRTMLTLTDADLPGVLLSGETIKAELSKTSDKTITVGNGDLYF